MTDTSNKAKTQCKKILRYLETHKRGLSQKDAYDKFGCFRLGARIWDLRSKGYDIETEYDTYVNEDGHNVRYGRRVEVRICEETL